MLTKQEQAHLRDGLFRHLDGIVTAPTAWSLVENGAIDYILKKGKIELEEMAAELKANTGYLNVALHVLCSQGWLNQLDPNAATVQYEINDQSAKAFNLFHHYRKSAELLKYGEKFHPRKFEAQPFSVLEEVYADLKELRKAASENSLEFQVMKHIEGIVVGPTAVHLGMSGMFHKYFMEARFKSEEFHEDPKNFGRLLDILTDLGWFNKENETYQFTDKGLFYAKRASAYGVTVSYIPILRRLDDLIFGDANKLRDLKEGQDEQHVDRAMNVWGSGGAHATYFKVVDKVIIDIFNQPLHKQPKGILDMGCGNGAFLIHLFDVIDNQTLRGEHLDEHPLTIVGVDYNKAALRISKANIIQADIWAKVIWGDIGKPELLADDLKNNYGIELSDLLNVRTFLDHNRVWDPPQSSNQQNGTSSGAFAHRGVRISNADVEASLLEHARKWSPHVSKHGLLIIELHTVKPEIAARNIGKTAATAYDATHGYSDQYILEIEQFNRMMEEAGLNSDPNVFRKFPNTDYATVSINLFKGGS